MAYSWAQYQNFCQSKGKTANYERWQKVCANKTEYGPQVPNNYTPFTPKPKKKHSGCKTWSNNGSNGLCGWNFSKERGMISFIASPKQNKGGILSGKGQLTEYKTKDGSGGKIYLVKITFKRTLETKLFTGFMADNSKVLTIPDIAMCANPKAKNGGYFGTFNTKK